MGSAIKANTEKVLKQWHPELIPLVACTDSKSLHECLVRLGTTNEERLMIDIICILQACERREITEIMWIPVNKNPADSMTKQKGICGNTLKNLIIDNKIIDIIPHG
ncbi:hypothetical protein EV44_g5933 [Erysiphe necator]|uniref:Uncharacterized protein n=1 Tax=Uncinula necator TaxID=52586 RepID=A0A0B1PEP4_UNCNE|nr:hypothetical protein EV44_g5933 [Erysiphe necator]